ncbi:uncharacterized protein SCHCODRAFT_02517746 [Schizophyllum commune H4-8]|nr:uncharacterized protein SCHCODRAFT_02517746 [Schizophyllum commune H4-8]KAI5886282.1 hypothetical protein SCHCODRAFT_02517746 [Schizophyllum commune H4-8]
MNSIPSSARLNREMNDLQVLCTLANELAGFVPFSPGYDRRKTSAKMTAMLIAYDRAAFSTLACDPLLCVQQRRTDVIRVVALSMGTFSSVTNVCRELKDISDVPEQIMRTFWPRIVVWGAALHPTHGHLTLAGFDTKPALGSLLQAYSMLCLDSIPILKPFLHANSAFVSEALDLWLYFPRYLPPSSMETTAMVTSTTHTIRALFKTLVSPNSRMPAHDRPTSEDRTLFVAALRRVLDRKRDLLLAIAAQTKFMIKLRDVASLADLMPTTQESWSVYFRVVIDLVALPDLKGTSIPGDTITSIVIAGRNCSKERKTGEGAMCAIYLLDILCRSARSNRPLARAVQAGLFDLLRAIPADWKIEEHDISDLIRLVCSGIHYARVIRAERDGAKLWSVTQEWVLIIALSRSAHAGTHSTAQEAANGWTIVIIAKLVVDTGKRGVCEPKGALSLADTLLISAVAQLYVARNRKVLSRKTMKLLARQDQPGRPIVKQAVIYIDLTDVLPEARHEVYAKTSYIPEGAWGDVLIEVSLRVGRNSITRTLPFAYDSKLLDIYARV